MRPRAIVLLPAGLAALACAGSGPGPRPAPAHGPATPSRAAEAPVSEAEPPIAIVELGHAAGQFHTLPVRVGEREQTVAILDTGIGLALISQGLCDRIGCAIDGEFVGQRMSGQEVRVPTTQLDQLELGGVVQRELVAGVIDIDGFFPEPQIEAFVGLPFFRELPFTIDGPQQRLIIESADSLHERASAAQSLAIRLQPHGPALDTFVRMSLDDEHEAELLMDTGSRTVILHPRYAELLGIDLSGGDVRQRRGSDETGHAYERHYVDLDVPVAFADAPELRRTGVEAMFQAIIYDGLIGTELLSSFVVTWDLPRARLLVSDP